MAKITIVGDAVVVTSKMKLEELKTISKYKPDALVLKGGEDGKEPVFAIGVTSCEGSINKYGASFCSATHDEAALATITLNYEGERGNITEFVAETLGAAIMSLNKLEETLPAVLADIEAQKAAVMASISVVQ